MSADFKVFIARERVWTRAQLQQQIAAAGYPLSLFADFDPLSHSGFLPCVLDGEETGFEYYFNTLEDTPFAPSIRPGIGETIGDRDSCVGFSMQYDQPNEMIAAAMTAGAIANLCDGIPWIADTFVKDVQPLDWANALIEEVRSWKA